MEFVFSTQFGKFLIYFTQLIFACIVSFVPQDPPLVEQSGHCFIFDTSDPDLLETLIETHIYFFFIFMVKLLMSPLSSTNMSDRMSGLDGFDPQHS